MEKFNLQWNDFMSTVSKSFGQLKKENEFYDVTLVSDDEEHVLAHKVVLAASSGFFKNILRKSTHSNPMLYLNGIKSKELNFILDYIYDGKVEMYQTDIDNFLNAAQKLRIEGLDFKKECGPDTSENIVREGELQPKYEQPVKSMSRKRAETSDSYIIASTNVGEIHPDLNELYTKTGNVFSCIKCEKTAKGSSDIRRHVEIHIEGLSFECPFNCGQIFRSRVLLKHHKSKCTFK